MCVLLIVLQETLSEAMKYNDQLRPFVNGIADDLNPLRVQVGGEVWDKCGLN